MTAARPRSPHDGDARLRELLVGTAAVRGLTLVWAFAVAVIDAHRGLLAHRLGAFTLLGVMVGWTAMSASLARRRPALLGRTPVLGFDLGLASVVVAADWFVYERAHSLSFGSAWPLAAVVAAGVLRGWRIGIAAGVVVGLGGVIGAALADRMDGRALALSGTVVLFSVAGAVSGMLTERLRRAESEVALVRAREQVATALHDGVLQTLAVIQRRSDDAELVGLARDQERALRTFLAGPAPGATGAARSDPSRVESVAAAVRRIAGVVERRHGVRVDVVVIADVEASPAQADAVAGAAGEAMTNAAKHADANHITASVDLDPARGGLLVAVVDDGRGFDPDQVSDLGRGLDRSVRARIEEVGGEVVVRSCKGHGTEVALWLPVGSAR